MRVCFMFTSERDLWPLRHIGSSFDRSGCWVKVCRKAFRFRLDMNGHMTTGEAGMLTSSKFWAFPSGSGTPRGTGQTTFPGSRFVECNWEKWFMPYMSAQDVWADLWCWWSHGGPTCSHLSGWFEIGGIWKPGGSLLLITSHTVLVLRGAGLKLSRFHSFLNSDGIRTSPSIFTRFNWNWRYTNMIFIFVRRIQNNKRAVEHVHETPHSWTRLVSLFSILIWCFYVNNFFLDGYFYCCHPF